MSRLLDAHRAVSRPSAAEIEDRHRCAWFAGAEQCHYPGTITRSTLGSGPWYCPAHSMGPDGHEGAQIVFASRAFRVGEERVAPPKPDRAPRPRIDAIDGTCELVQEEPGADG